MLKRILSLLCIALPLAFFVASCGDDDDPATCDTSDVTYTNGISTILNNNCASAGCHNSGSVNGSLANYNDAVAFVAFGRIVGAINHSNGFSPMPYPQGSDKLSDCNIDKIEAWISDGTPQ